MELRVHGIGGPDPEGVLGGPAKSSMVSWRSEPGSRSVVRCTAGDQTVHVYHWSPLTSGSRGFALWPLLLPYTLVNVAGWMAPPGKREGRRTLHRVGVVWVGLATTAATVVWLLMAALAVWREVSGGSRGRAPGEVSGLYFAAAAASAALVMAAIVFAATHMAHGFERYRPPTWSEPPKPWRWPWGAGTTARLDDQHFFDNGEEHKVRWRVHFGVAVATFIAVVGTVFVRGSEQAGYYVGRGLVTVGLLQSLGVALILVAGLLPDPDDHRRLTQRMLGAATALLGVLLLGGLVLSALISVTGIDEVTPGPSAILYDCYGWATLAAIGGAVAVLVVTLLSPVTAERVPDQTSLPTISSRIRARLATMLSNLDRIVCAWSIGFALTTFGAIGLRWSELFGDTWRLTATPPVSVARSTFAFVLAFTVLNLIKSRAAPATLRRVGNVWDILTFWPRAFHPFAVRPYADHAVPELQEFLRSAPRRDGMVVAAHSQGTVLAYAAVRPYVAGGSACETPLPPFALVTFGSPLQALYAAVFPHYFSVDDFAATRDDIPGGWTNCFRFTDHVGRAVFSSDGDVASGNGAPADRPIADGDGPGGVVNGHNAYWEEEVVRKAVSTRGVP